MTQPLALVAGGSRGLGLHIARELLQRRYQVAICARSADDLDAAAGLLAPYGKVHTRVTDVGDADQVTSLVSWCEREFGSIEVLMNVAGIITIGPATSMTEQDYEAALATMLWGPIRLTRAVLPGMTERDRGRIGTITSIGGKLSPPHLLPYAVAKHGAVGFSEGLTAHLSGTGVSATTIVPGLMRVGGHEQATFKGNAAAEYAWFGAAASVPFLTIPAHRAARKIVTAVLAGKPVLSLTALSAVGARVHGLAPGSTVRLLGLVNRFLLPSAPATEPNPPHQTGRQAREQLSRPARAAHDVLTTLGRRAARLNNERNGQSPG